MLRHHSRLDTLIGSLGEVHGLGEVLVAMPDRALLGHFQDSTAAEAARPAAADMPKDTDLGLVADCNVPAPSPIRLPWHHNSITHMVVVRRGLEGFLSHLPDQAAACA